jgi:RNA recognition motif-containing protein
MLFRMGKRLYVGNLPYTTNDDQLRDLFSEAGTVTDSKVMIDRMTNRSRGFAFVEMSTDEEAQAAVEKMNGREIDGRKLTVNEARPQAERPPRTGGGGGGGRGFFRRGGFGGGQSEDRY